MEAHDILTDHLSRVGATLQRNSPNLPPDRPVPPATELRAAASNAQRWVDVTGPVLAREPDFPTPGPLLGSDGQPLQWVQVFRSSGRIAMARTAKEWGHGSPATSHFLLPSRLTPPLPPPDYELPKNLTPPTPPPSPYPLPPPPVPKSQEPSVISAADGPQAPVVSDAGPPLSPAAAEPGGASAAPGSASAGWSGPPRASRASPLASGPLRVVLGVAIAAVLALAGVLIANAASDNGGSSAGAPVVSAGSETTAETTTAPSGSQDTTATTAAPTPALDIDGAYTVQGTISGTGCAGGLTTLTVSHTGTSLTMDAGGGATLNGTLHDDYSFDARGSSAYGAAIATGQFADNGSGRAMIRNGTFRDVTLGECSQTFTAQK